MASAPQTAEASVQSPAAIAPASASGKSAAPAGKSPARISVFASANRAFVHTEIDSAYEGKGLGKVLVREALDATRDVKLGVLPFCPFVHRYVDKNPEYLALVPDWARERLGLPTA